VAADKLLDMLYEKEAHKTAKQEMSMKLEDDGPSKSFKGLDDSKRLQRELSVGTLASKNTRSTLTGLVLAPTFKFGIQRMH
jgi:hypothetical protein